LPLCWLTEEQSGVEQLSANIGRVSVEHLLLTSSSAILFGFGPGLECVTRNNSM